MGAPPTGPGAIVRRAKRFPPWTIGAILLLQIASFWPVWRWFAVRLTDGSDDPWGVCALAAAMVCSWPRIEDSGCEPSDPLLRLAAILTCMYAALIFVAPPIVRAIPALAALGCAWVSATGARDRVAAIVALFVLSLPLLASLQFYWGYPMRALTAAAATQALNLLGLDVVRSGTAMLWGGRTILVDAPCSGIRMLWTATFLVCLLAAQRPTVRARDLALVLAPVLPVVLCVNALRAAVLFVLETRLLEVSVWAHSLLGCALFALLAVALFVCESIARRKCQGQPARVSQTHPMGAYS